MTKPLTALLLALSAGSLLCAGANSSVSLAVSPTTSTLGGSVTLTATVSPATATGMVTFYDGVATVGANRVTSGSASISTILLAPGSHLLTAYYGGSASFNPSTSSAIKQIVNAVPEVGFGPPGSIVGNFSTATAGDFNGDGREDLIINGSVLLGNGTGGFYSSNNQFGGYYVPVSIPNNYPIVAYYAGDFNGDGHTDLIALGNTGFATALGNGDGTFTAGASMSVTLINPQLVVGDFNGDGKADVVVESQTAGSGSLTFYAGIGDGSFAAGVTAYAGSVFIQSAILQVADFNGDGKADLVTVNTDSSVTVLLGNGNDTFGSPLTVTAQSFLPPEYSSGYYNDDYNDVTYPPLLVSADFNGDGKTDLAVLTAQGFAVFLGAGNGTFTAGAAYTLAGVTAVTKGDFNGDGNTDLLVEAAAGIYIYLGKGDGTFTAGNTGISTGYSNAPILLTGDFNGDGLTDFVTNAKSATYGLQGSAVVVFPGLGQSQGSAIMPLLTNVTAPDPGFPSYLTNGTTFTVGPVPITVKAIGRFAAPGDSQVHQLSIAGTTAQGVVNMSGSTAGTYVYTAVPPTVLAPNTTYTLSSVENGVDTVYGSYSYTASSAASVFLYGGNGLTNLQFELGGDFAPPAQQSPSVSVTSPTNNSTASGTITLSAMATPVPGDSVASVQFQIGTLLLPPITAAPYIMTFDTTKLANGPQNVSATVVDSGFNAASSAVKITVNNGSYNLSPFFTGAPVTAVRNNYAGYVGMQITVGSTAVQVSQLGRWVVAGSTQAHIVKIFNVSTGLDVPGGSVTLDLNGVAPNAYAYAPLASPITLYANSVYYIVSQEFSGGDSWYDIGPVANSGVATVNSGIYTDAEGKYNSAGNSGSAYVPVNFLYASTGSGTQAPPVVTITAPTAGPVPTLIDATATAVPGPGLAIVSVQFYLNGAKIGPLLTSAPYATALDLSQATPGNNTLTAVAIDTAGDSGTSAAVQLTVGAAGLTPFITGFTGGPLRNNYSGYVGTYFTVGPFNLVVTQLGRFAVSGNKQTHTVQILSNPYGTNPPYYGFTTQVVASASVATAGATSGQFVYSTLSAPVTLYSGQTYLLVSQEFGGGDSWYDFGPVNTTSVASVGGSIFSDAAGNYQPVAVTGTSYVPANFAYKQNESVTITSPSTYTISGTVTLAATAMAAPGLSITSVQFKYNGNNIGTLLTSPPYSEQINTYSLPNGYGAFSVVATDSSGGTVTSNQYFDVENASAGNPFFSAGNLSGTLRNNFSGFVGTELTIGSTPLLVNQLGRYTISGNNQMHIVKLVNADGSDVPGGSVSLSLNGALAGQFNYVSFPNPITLQANTTYFLVSQELNGGDQWYDLGVNVNTLYQVAAVKGGIYTDASSHYVLVAMNGGTYVPPNFTYTYATASSTPFLSGSPTSTLRNNYSGFVGMQFTVSYSAFNGLEVSHLGRYVVAGNSQTHIVKLVDSTGADVPGGSVTIATSSATPGQFAYAPLSSPLYLQANQTYYLVSQEVSGGDQWYDVSQVTANTSEATVNGPAYTNTAGQYVLYPATGFSYFIVNFQ